MNRAALRSLLDAANFCSGPAWFYHSITSCRRSCAAGAGLAQAAPARSALALSPQMELFSGRPRASNRIPCCRNSSTSHSGRRAFLCGLISSGSRFSSAFNRKVQSLTHRFVLPPPVRAGRFHTLDRRYISWCSRPPECLPAPGPAALRNSTNRPVRTARASRLPRGARQHLICRLRFEVAATNELRLLQLHRDFQFLQAGA